MWASPAPSPCTSHRALNGSALGLLRDPLRLRAVEIALDACPSNPLVLASPIQLEQVFLSLLTNACDPIDQAPRKQIVIRTAIQGATIEAVVERIRARDSSRVRAPHPRFLLHDQGYGQRHRPRALHYFQHHQDPPGHDHGGQSVWGRSLFYNSPAPVAGRQVRLRRHDSVANAASCAFRRSEGSG